MVTACICDDNRSSVSDFYAHLQAEWPQKGRWVPRIYPRRTSHTLSLLLCPSPWIVDYNMFRVPFIVENAEKYWNLTLSIFKNIEILAVLEWYCIRCWGFCYAGNISKNKELHRACAVSPIFSLLILLGCQIVDRICDLCLLLSTLLYLAQ